MQRNNKQSKSNIKGDDSISQVAETLISKDEVFISNGKSSSEVFEDVASQLYEAGLVKADFLENIIKRESAFPTGMDLSVVDNSLSNIAIPHTEGEFVNSRKIIPVKLTNEVAFNNMINPDEELKVKFLFMVLNNDPDGQANILAEIMSFVSSSDVGQLQQMFDSNFTDFIFKQLKNKFE